VWTRLLDYGHAAQPGELEAVKMLLAAGAEVAVRGGKGHTALRVAQMCNQREVVKFLAERGAPS